MMLRGWGTSVHISRFNLFRVGVGGVGRQVMIRYKSGSRSQFSSTWTLHSESSKDVIWLNSHPAFHEIKPQSVATLIVPRYRDDSMLKHAL